MDNSLDVTDQCKGEGEDNRGGKGGNAQGGPNDKSTKANNLFEFVKNLLDDIKANNILKDST